MILKFSSHLLVIMSMFYSFAGHAHDADKAYFKIKEAVGNVVVFAEFPWSIRKVLDNIKTQDDVNQDLQVKLLKYIKQHLILEKDNGGSLPIISVELFQSRKEGHHSTVNYKIIFKGSQLYKVTNTLMCDYYKDQLNYHILFDQSDSKITSAKNSSFLVKRTPFKFGLMYFGGVLLVLILVVTCRIIKRNTL